MTEEDTTTTSAPLAMQAAKYAALFGVDMLETLRELGADVTLGAGKGMTMLGALGRIYSNSEEATGGLLWSCCWADQFEYGFGHPAARIGFQTLLMFK